MPGALLQVLGLWLFAGVNREIQYRLFESDGRDTSEFIKLTTSLDFSQGLITLEFRYLECCGCILSREFLTTV